MNTRRLPFFLSMLIGAILSACGPTQEEINATATQVAADIFATQTAQAPTSTPTSTPSPTPTVTPTATATLTPTPTITPTPAPQLSEAALTLDDLPAGFQAIPEEEANQMKQSLPANVVAFGYRDEGSNQLLLGYLIPYASQAEQLAFDQMMPQLCESFAAGLGAASAPEMLEGLEYIGETRTGCTSVTASTEGDVRFDTVLFRRGEIAEIIMIGYPDAEQPAVSMNDLARLLDLRISEFLGLAVTSLPENIPLEELMTLAQAEGELNVIALPHDWANYGEIIQTFKQKYGLKINELDPEAGSADELEAIRLNMDNEGPQAPDVVDIGLGFTGEAQSEGLLVPYKVAGWDSIPDPVKDPAGSWWGNYFGVLTFEVNTDLIENIPGDWDDLLKPEYKGKVAMGGEVTKSNMAVMTVLAAGLSRTNGEIETAPEAGLQFWKEMKASGNLLPVNGNQDTLASGETPIVIRWDYLALADRDLMPGDPNLEIVVPQTGVLAGPYANAISAYAPHPYAARLWSEFIMSDEGQLLFLEGYAHPIRFLDMLARGVIPQNKLDKLPAADAYKEAVFLTPEELITAKDYIVENWVRVVGD